MSDLLVWIGKAVGIGLLAVYLLLMAAALLLVALSWPTLKFLLLERRWREVRTLQKTLEPRRPILVILWALGLRDMARGPNYWPWKPSYRLLGATTPEQRAVTEGRIQAWNSIVEVVRLATGQEELSPTSPSFKTLVSQFFPRWKACVLLGAVLTALTVFVPHNGAWAIFCLVSVVVCWRGFRDPKIPKWGDFIRLGLIGAFVGTLLFSFLVDPIQRNGLVRLSRDVYLSSPESFLCCIWDGQPPRERAKKSP